MASHGVAMPRGQAPRPASRGGTFGRMFGFLAACDTDELTLDALFAVMERRAAVDSEDNGRIPAGYTYLGQFIDHDMTFDPTSQLGRDNEPEALVNFRTPRLDLDSLYGSGWADQPYLYDWDGSPCGVRLLVGHNPPDDCLDPDDRPAPIDLPRNEQGRALIGDPRNDENLIVAQMHLLFIHFHNKVVDCLVEDKPWLEGAAILEEAQRIVRWHYQWIVTHDFLDLLVGETTAHRVLRPGVDGEPPSVQRDFYKPGGEPAIPVEFSGAAYRCGHTMVRDTYVVRDGEREVPILVADGSKRHLGGFRRLPAALTIDWAQFFAFADKPEPQHGLKLDTNLTRALFALPPDGAALAHLNLRRGRALGLPSGQAVARAMGLDPLPHARLLLDDAGDLLTADQRATLLRATPLWYYVLCEARTSQYGAGGQHLGTVGGRIVAEVLVGLVQDDPQSYLSQAPAWTPTLRCAEPGRFTMSDLIAFTFPELYAPTTAGAATLDRRRARAPRGHIQ